MLATETTVAVVDAGNESTTEMEKSLSKAVTEIEVQAGTITISNEGEYNEAATFGRMLKQRMSDVKSFWKPMKDAAHKAHTAICSKEKAMLTPLENAEKILKKTMGAYVAEQEKKRREAEEAARRAAQEEVERKMREAVALEAKGDRIAAKAAMEEAEVMDDAAMSISVPTTKPKASGVSSSKDWQIINIDVGAVPVAVQGTIIRPVDEAAVMRLIRSSKGTIRIPGISYREVAKIAFRK